MTRFEKLIVGFIVLVVAPLWIFWMTICVMAVLKYLRS
jgi:hypothetical protein